MSKEIFEEKKQKILDIVKNNNGKPPFTWTQIAQKIGINYNYTVDARKPLQNWYKVKYDKLSKEWCQQNLSTNNFSYPAGPYFNNLSRSLKNNINPEVTNSVQKALITTFDRIKKISLEFKEPKLVEYYSSFFKYFTSDVILDYKILHGLIGKNAIDKFKTVSNLEEFKNYFESTPGLYSKLILWAQQNPFPLENFKIIHHSMPEYMCKFGFSSKQLNQPYNLVYVNRVIHYLIHIIRLVEYAQPEDSYSVELMLRDQASNTIISWGSTGLQDSVKIMFRSLQSEMFQNYPEYEIVLTETKKKQILNLNRTKMSQITKKVLTSKTIWSHLNDKKFRWTHFPQEDTNVNLNDFTNAIMKAYTDHQISYNQKPLIFEDKKLKPTREMFSKYIRGETQFAYKLYIIDPPDLIK